MPNSGRSDTEKLSKPSNKKNNTIKGKEGMLDFFISTSVCFRVLKNRIVDIPAPTAASVKDTSMPSNNKKIRADIRLKIVVAMIAENKFLANITYSAIAMRIINSKYKNIIVILFLLYFQSALRMLELKHELLCSQLYIRIPISTIVLNLITISHSGALDQVL